MDSLIAGNQLMILDKLNKLETMMSTMIFIFMLFFVLQVVVAFVQGLKKNMEVDNEIHYMGKPDSETSHGKI